MLKKLTLRRRNVNAIEEEQTSGPVASAGDGDADDIDYASSRTLRSPFPSSVEVGRFPTVTLDSVTFHSEESFSISEGGGRKRWGSFGRKTAKKLRPEMIRRLDVVPKLVDPSGNITEEPYFYTVPRHSSGQSSDLSSTNNDPLTGRAVEDDKHIVKTENNDSEVQTKLQDVEVFLDEQAEQLAHSKPSAATHLEHWISHCREEVRQTRSALEAGVTEVPQTETLRYFYRYRHAFQFAREITTEKALKKLEFLLKEKAIDVISLNLLDICAEHLLDDLQSVVPHTMLPKKQYLSRCFRNGNTDMQCAVLQYMDSLLERFPDVHTLFLQQNLCERLSPFLSYGDNGVEPQVKLLAEKLYQRILTERERQASKPSASGGNITQGLKGSEPESTQEVGDGESTKVDDGESSRLGGGKSAETGDGERTKVEDGEESGWINNHMSGEQVPTSNNVRTDQT